MIKLMEEEYRLLESAFEAADIRDEQMYPLYDQNSSTFIARTSFNLTWFMLTSFNLTGLKSCICEIERFIFDFLVLTKGWYTHILDRIRINAFRNELAGGLYEDLLLSAAASAEAAVGNAVYVVPSFYNHDCDPNAHILWIENVDAKMKALRDIEEGEELRISYIDASMDRDARQKILFERFGFRCRCLRCSSND
ncbi:unnamed protein product [Ilex paraguariensis]|uniref:SET domain-containing protein n=1 Tax=Ilex paraguariensis TaxID=185542 RepID=A0ABC8S417_9AQUA